MPATATKAKEYRGCETVIGSNLASGVERVDEANGVIRGVKLVGCRSRNIGRTIGLDVRDFGDAVNLPYEYAIEALIAAIPLYEAASIYSNHLPWAMEGGVRQMANGERKNSDLLGWPSNVRPVQTGDPEVDGLYGDWHYVKAHDMAPTIVEIARRKPDKLALSHEALFGDVSVRNGRCVIGKIHKVEALAVVNQQPGTTRGLFETAAGNHTMPRTIKQVLEALAADTFGRAVALELVTAGGDAMAALPMDQPANGTSADAQIKAAFRTMIMAAFDDESLDTKATIDRFRKIMSAMDKLSGATETATGGDASGANKDSKAAETAAGANAMSPTTTVPVTATKNDPPPVIDRGPAVIECADMLAAVGIPAKGVVLEAMVALPTTEKRAAYVQEMAARKGVDANAPRPRTSAPPPAGGKPGEKAKAADTFKEKGSLAKAMR